MKRYSFIIDSRDFSIVTEKAVEKISNKDTDPSLEHLIEIANRTPEIVVILDDEGHMSAWGLENAGCRNEQIGSVFNIAHVEGMNISFGKRSNSEDEYAQFCTFAGGLSDSSLTLLVHYLDGRINWFDAPPEKLFSTGQREDRVRFIASWTGHQEPIAKIARSRRGDHLLSRTNDNEGILWQRSTNLTIPILTRRSQLTTSSKISRICILDGGQHAIVASQQQVSIWDMSKPSALELAVGLYKNETEVKAVVLLPRRQTHIKEIDFVTIDANMYGTLWRGRLPTEVDLRHPRNQHGESTLLCVRKFRLRNASHGALVAPIDPVGSHTLPVKSFPAGMSDVLLSISATGTLIIYTAASGPEADKVILLVTTQTETDIANASLASASTIRKAAIVDESRSGLTIWDTSNSQLEIDFRYPDNEVVQDLDWTSTPDEQSILAVGFPRKVILVTQLRYDYLRQGPSWASIREIKLRDVTSHPIGDSCWLGTGNLVIGAGNQMFVYDRSITPDTQLLSDLPISPRDGAAEDLFSLVRRLNGALPVFHPQFIGQCILRGKTALVSHILLTLHKKLKFWSEGDDLSSFLDIPLESIVSNEIIPQPREMNTFEGSNGISFENGDNHLSENVAALLAEILTRVTLPQLSNKDQLFLADLAGCIASFEKQRRSLDENAARYILFFRQHFLHKSSSDLDSSDISWREIVWAFHSASQDILVDLVSRSHQGKLNWQEARESGMFVWLQDLDAVRCQLEVVARNKYTKSEDRSPTDCSLYYLALRKKSVLQGLWRMAHGNREQQSTQKLLANDFTDKRWRTTAQKNAYALLGRRRFEYAAAFFLLADSLRDAVNVCVNNLHDTQLAITITRAYEGDDGPVLEELLTDRILPEANLSGNKWMATWAFWMLKKREKAVRCLISPIHTLMNDTSRAGSPSVSTPSQSKSFRADDPSLTILYSQLRAKTLSTLKGAVMIEPREEWDFVLRNARLYVRMGCDLLALDLLRNWEFLLPKPAPALQNGSPEKKMADPRKLLRRRSSLVIDDVTLAATEAREVHVHDEKSTGTKAPPTIFEEPSVSSLLDNFGF